MYDIDLRTSNRGIYLSHQMVDVLLLINSTSDELEEYVRNNPNLSKMSEDEINHVTTIAKTDLVQAKKYIFEKYQNSYIDYMIMSEIKNNPRFVFHLKLEDLKLPIEVEERLFNVFIAQGEKACYRLLSTMNISDKQIRDIRLSSLDDYENIKSATFEQIVAFNEQIKSDIVKAKNHGGDYTLVIGASRFFNTMFISPESSLSRGYQYEPYFVEQGYRLTEKLEGAYTRFHCIIDRNTAKALFEEKKYTKANKEEVLELLAYFTTKSLHEVEKLNQNGKKINVVELFNELIECNKEDKNAPYHEVWQQYFGISINDIMERCILPNADIITRLKNNGVKFMYNETLLQESHNKRAEVEKIYDFIQQQYPDLIEIFGNQMHYTDSDLSPDGIIQLQEEALFMQKMQQKRLSNGNTLATECTEFDFGINKVSSKTALEMLSSGKMTELEIQNTKQNMINTIRNIFSNVGFTRHCDWTTLDNIDCRIVREGRNKEVNKGERFFNLFSGKFTEISKMQKSYSQQRMEYEREKLNIQRKYQKFTVEREKVRLNTENKKQELNTSRQGNRFHLKEIKRKERKKVTETQTINPTVPMLESYQQMKQKTAEKKAEMRQDKPKVLTRKLPNNQNNNAANVNNGFIKTITLLMIIGFVVGAMSLFVYLLCK